jgi:hypothetical protein
MKKIVRLTENDLMRLVKRVIKEQQSTKFDKNYFATKKRGTFTLNKYGIPSSIDGVTVNDFDSEVQQYFGTFEIGGRGTQAGEYVWNYSEQSSTGRMGPGQSKPGIIVTDKSGREIGSATFR